MDNGSLSMYLDKHYDDLTGTCKFSLVSPTSDNATRRHPSHPCTTILRIKHVLPLTPVYTESTPPPLD